MRGQSFFNWHSTVIPSTIKCGFLRLPVGSRSSTIKKRRHRNSMISMPSGQNLKQWPNCLCINTRYSGDSGSGNLSESDKCMSAYESVDRRRRIAAANSEQNLVRWHHIQVCKYSRNPARHREHCGREDGQDNRRPTLRNHPASHNRLKANSTKEYNTMSTRNGRTAAAFCRQKRFARHRNCRSFSGRIAHTSGNTANMFAPLQHLRKPQKLPRQKSGSQCFSSLPSSFTN